MTFAGPVDNMMHLRSLQDDELKPLHPLLKASLEQVEEQWYQLYASSEDGFSAEEFSGMFAAFGGGAAALLMATSAFRNAR